MGDVTLRFKHDGHITKRCVRYKELDDTGAEKEQVEAVLGTLYVKKSYVGGSPYPEHLTIKMEW